MDLQHTDVIKVAASKTLTSVGGVTHRRYKERLYNFLGESEGKISLGIYVYVSVLTFHAPKLCSIFRCPNLFHFDFPFRGLFSGFETRDALRGGVVSP